MRPRPGDEPSRTLSAVDVTAVTLLTPVALLSWAGALSGGPYGGGLLYALLLAPLAAAPVLVAGVLRLAGRRSRTTGRWLTVAAGLTVAGICAIPVVAALEERLAREQRESVAHELEEVTRSCAASAVGQVAEPAEGDALRSAMQECMQGPGSERLRREVAWRIQCVAGGCSAYATQGLSQEPLLVGVAGYLDEALDEAGRPGWARFLQPGDPAPRRGVSGIERTG